MRPLPLVAALVLLTPTSSAQELTPESFERLHAELVPAKPAKWEQIPWRTDLLAARQEAIETRRPLFLWTMNGHPLGCT